MIKRILKLAFALLLMASAVATNASKCQAQLAAKQAIHAPAQVKLMPAPAAGLVISPVLFVENVGQWDDGARFQVWGGPAGTMWLADDAIWITVIEASEGERGAWEDDELLEADRSFDCETIESSRCRAETASRRGVNIKLSFVGANPQPHMETFARLETMISYFIGNDPEQWWPDVPVWSGVRYVDLYPGVDLELTYAEGRMVSRLAVRPGADLSAVQLRVDGAEAVSVDGALLRLHAAGRDYVFPMLQTDTPSGEADVQPRGAGIFDLSAPFVAPSSSVHLYNATPNAPADNLASLLYSTFLGGSGEDYVNGIAADGTGRAYVVGWTWSSNFPTTPDAFNTSMNGGDNDAFVAKLNPAGNGLVYATFLGGSGSDNGIDIAVDETGSAYVTGWAAPSDFPTTPGAFDTSYSGGDHDAFVAKLNPTGSEMVYTTFLGGSGSEGGRGIAVDGMGSAYVSGWTESSDFPTTPGAFDMSFNDGDDAFVVKFNPAGNGLAYATFLGGSSNDYGNAIAVDRAGSAYVTGLTYGVYDNDFPTTPGAFDVSHNYDYDAFVAKLNPTGSMLAYATFLGGSRYDNGSTIAVDGTGSAYVAGWTESSDFPSSPGAFDTSFYGANSDAFMAKLNLSGSMLIYSTFLGGDGSDEISDIVVDDSAMVYVTGTAGHDFPTTPSAFDTSFNGGVDAFVVKFNRAGSALAYASFLGGSDEDRGSAIAVDRLGSAYVAGFTSFYDFPTTPGAFDTSYNGGYYDALVAKLAVTANQYLPLMRRSVR